MAMVRTRKESVVVSPGGSIVQVAQDKFLQETVESYLDKAQIPRDPIGVSESGRLVRCR